MKIQIDQSGKIEQTNKDTILCISNHTWDSVLIPSKVKRQLQELFRKNGRIRTFILVTFCAGLSILIQRNKSYPLIIIDREYFGHEHEIKTTVLQMLDNNTSIPRIEFDLIGKKAMAHNRAYAVATKKMEPGKRITLIDLMRQIKKTEVGKRLKNA